MIELKGSFLALIFESSRCLTSVSEIHAHTYKHCDDISFNYLI
jgi:hypothetical protein